MLSLLRRHNGRLKSPASRLFTRPFSQAQIKNTSKLRVTGFAQIASAEKV